MTCCNQNCAQGRDCPLRVTRPARGLLVAAWLAMAAICGGAFAGAAVANGEAAAEMMGDRT